VGVSCVYFIIMHTYIHLICSNKTTKHSITNVTNAMSRTTRHMSLTVAL